MSDSIPKEIYLQVCPEHGVFCGDDVTWCVDQINDTDICYINEADLTALRRRAELATEYELMRRIQAADGRWFGEICIKRREQRDGSMKWGVYQRDSFVLTRDGHWLLEPIPSSRDDEWLADTRYDSLDEAWDMAEKAIAIIEVELAAAYREQA